MAKGTGLIGNFKGKVGNTVGYKLSASNNGQTQGIRVYQPIVKNPKTAAQAEQRAKLAPINATYRALKMVIDRGNEGLPYGNKSRLAWLKGALKAENMPWFVKGSIPTAAVLTQLTKGSLAIGSYSCTEDNIMMVVPGLDTAADYATVGALSTALIAADGTYKAGDQLTFVVVHNTENGMAVEVKSIVLDATSSEAITGFSGGQGNLKFEPANGVSAAAVILSREGANGEHLRSNSTLVTYAGATAAAPYDATSKTAAIESYQSSSASNSDWAEESIQ